MSGQESVAVIEKNAPVGGIELERRVRNFLFARSVPALRRLDVDVKGDSVVLAGRVRSFYEKQLALHCCRRVAGVVKVVDSIEVDMAHAVSN